MTQDKLKSFDVTLTLRLSVTCADETRAAYLASYWAAHAEKPIGFPHFDGEQFDVKAVSRVIARLAGMKASGS